MNCHMHSHMQGRKAKGFSLIEALIAVVVLATGLLALTALQGALIRNSADAKARSQLATYAQSLMDGARRAGYGAIQTGTNAALLSATTGSSLANAAQAMGVGSLTETSTVTLVSNGSSEYKTINLRLNWQDAAGATRTLSMRSVVSPLLLSTSPLNEVDPTAIGNYRPIVRRLSPVTDGMIPIALGGDEQTAATNPKPQLLGSTGTYVSDTAFDILTYNTSDNLGVNNFVRFDKRIQTRIVGCTCQDNANGFGSGSYATFLKAKAARPTYWDGDRYVEPALAPYGVTSSPSSDPQSELCTVCCRDHQDPSGQAAPLYSPWPGQSATHDVQANKYDESCRVIRVNGVFRVAADPKILDLALVPTQTYPSSPNNADVAKSPLIADQGRQSYVSYVFDYVKQVFSDGTELSTRYDVNAAAIQQQSGLNNPDYVPVSAAGDVRWLHARAFLTDYLEPDAVKRIVRAKANKSGTGNPCAGSSAEDLAKCVLPYSPIATINVTEIANWSTRSKGTGDTLPATLAGVADAFVNYAKASIARFNSGLALAGAVNTGDEQAPASDEQLFFRLGSVAPTSPWLTTPNPNPSTAQLFGLPLFEQKPLRGYAQVQSNPSYKFKIDWGLDVTKNTTVTDDPSASAGVICSANTVRKNGKIISDPFACETGVTTNAPVQLSGYNRLRYEPTSETCDGQVSTVQKPVCDIFVFKNAVTDTPAGTVSTYRLVSALDTKNTRKEVIEIIVPAIAAGGGTTVSLTFDGPTSTPGTRQCVGQTAVYSVPAACQ